MAVRIEDRTFLYLQIGFLASGCLLLHSAVTVAYDSQVTQKPENVGLLIGLTLLGIAFLGGGGVFGLLNAPFFLANPQAWLHGVFQRSLVYDDHNALAYFQLAETLGASGGFDGTSYSADELRQAVDAYQTAIDLGFPQAALAYKGMGWAQIALEDYESASRALSQAMQSPLLREPGYVWDLANTYEGLAKAFAGQSDETGAAHYEALARELALNPVTP